MVGKSSPKNNQGARRTGAKLRAAALRVKRKRQSKDWSISDARARISDVFDAAIKDGPQTIVRRGEESVVVVSSSEFERLQKLTPDFAEFLLSCPLEPNDIPARAPARIRDF